MTATLPREAHACFLRGEALYKQKHYLDAQVLFDRACRLAPQNADYQAARARLGVLAFGFGKKHGAAGAENSSTAAECCGNCCECGGEACGEGCCETCCESCDCDCS